MTDREALYRAVLAHPDDDLPRLVLADWFEENGCADRAVYIRAQVELAGLVARNSYEEEYLAATAVVSAVPVETLWAWVREDGLPVGEESPLLARSLDADLDQVRDVGAGWSYIFRRGFVEGVQCPAMTWIHYAAAFKMRAPLAGITLAGKQPFRRRPTEWVWRAPDGLPVSAAGTLPGPLFDHLPGRQGGEAVYPSRRAADDALTAACLAFARTQHE